MPTNRRNPTAISPTTSSSTRASRRVLVVDDNFPNRDLLQRILSREGFDVQLAENGQHALETIAVEPFDAVLLDVMMPVLDGFETCLRIREELNNPHLPVIMLTCRDTPEDIARAFSAGATDYIAKPVRKPELFARLNAAIATMSGHRQLEQHIAQRTAELARTNHALSRQLDALAAAENELRKSHQYLQEILNNTSDAYIVITGDWCIQYVNPAFSTLFDTPPAAVSGKPLWTVIPDLGEELRQRLARTLYDRQPTEMTVFYPPENRWLHIRAFHHRSGMTICLRDLTSEKQHEQQIARRDAQLHAILETVIDGIVTIDDRGIIQSFNPAFAALFGFEPEELEGANIGKIMPAPFRMHHDRNIQNYLKTGIPRIIGRSREIYGQRKNGTMFPVEIAVTETRFDEQRLFTGLVRDITERKRAETELIEMRDHLQEKVDAQTRDLIKARDEALAAERTMSAFLANMGHEIRTPLHAILSYARFGQESIETLSSDTAELNELKEHFDIINESAEDLLSLLNDLLDLSKLRAGKMVYDYTEVDLVTVTREIIAQCLRLLEEKGILATVQTSGRHRRIVADHRKIGQVIRNLLTNAMKFSPPDSTIDIEIDYTDTDTTLLRVIDNGPGIPPDETEAIFEPFQQSSKTNSNAGGTGLGLAICKEIIANGHHGWIKAVNNESGGATFIFALPCRLPEAF